MVVIPITKQFRYYDYLTIIKVYYLAALSYKRAHIAKHYIFNAGNGN